MRNIAVHNERVSHLQILADQLTLILTGRGADYAHQIILAPPRIFRPSYGPVLQICTMYILHIAYIGKNPDLKGCAMNVKSGKLNLFIASLDINFK